MKRALSRRGRARRCAAPALQGPATAKEDAHIVLPRDLRGSAARVRVAFRTLVRILLRHVPRVVLAFRARMGAGSRSRLRCIFSGNGFSGAAAASPEPIGMILSFDSPSWTRRRYWQDPSAGTREDDDPAAARDRCSRSRRRAPHDNSGACSAAAPPGSWQWRQVQPRPDRDTFNASGVVLPRGAIANSPPGSVGRRDARRERDVLSHRERAQTRARSMSGNASPGEAIISDSQWTHKTRARSAGSSAGGLVHAATGTAGCVRREATGRRDVHCDR